MPILQRTPPNSYGGRNLGTMTSANLSRNPTGVRLDQRPGTSAAPLVDPAVSTVRSVGVPRPAMQASAVTRTPPQMGGFGLGPSRVMMDGVTPVPPQQTERANPLTGGNNIPMKTTSVPVSSPFSQRGGAGAMGQDAAAVEAAQDENIGNSMQGTFDRLRGAPPRSAFAPRFSQPAQRQPSYLDRIFRATPEMQL